MEKLHYCKHCNTKKPESSFYHYYTPNGKLWVHWSICLACENENNKVRYKRNYIHKRKLLTPRQIIKRKERLLEFQKKGKTKICSQCTLEYPETDEYFYYMKKAERFETLCRGCRNDNMKVYRGGDIPNDPGEFDTEEERLETHNFLLKLGWKYSITTKMWYKPGIKSLHNHWKFQQYKRKKLCLESLNLN
jgi:hypothetical protein